MSNLAAGSMSTKSGSNSARRTRRITWFRRNNKSAVFGVVVEKLDVDEPRDDMLQLRGVVADHPPDRPRGLPGVDGREGGVVAFDQPRVIRGNRRVEQHLHEDVPEEAGRMPSASLVAWRVRRASSSDKSPNAGVW